MFPLKETTRYSYSWDNYRPTRKQCAKQIKKKRLKNIKAEMRKQVNEANKKIGY